MRALRLAPLLLLALSCGCPGDTKPNGPAKGGDKPQTPADSSTVKPAVEAHGPPFDLSEGAPVNEPWKPVTLAKAKQLDAQRTGALLKRLPKLEDPETTTFARREGPPPPKLTGETVKTTFPPKSGPP
jgi:hypothetical protein